MNNCFRHSKICIKLWLKAAKQSKKKTYLNDTKNTEKAEVWQAFCMGALESGSSLNGACIIAVEHSIIPE